MAYKMTITIEDQEGNSKKSSRLYESKNSKEAYTELFQKTAFSYMQIVDLVQRREVTTQDGTYTIKYQFMKVL